MTKTFKDILNRIDKEAKEDGAEADVERLRAHFRLGRRLAERRLELGLSQKALADRTGLQQADISRIEGGAGNPTFDKLSAIAAGLKGKLEFRAEPPRRRRSR